MSRRITRNPVPTAPDVCDTAEEQDAYYAASERFWDEFFPEEDEL